MDFLKKYLNDEYLWSNSMLEMIMAYFKGVNFMKFSKSMSFMGDILEHLEENFENDKEAKNAMIDTMIQILQSHKDK